MVENSEVILIKKSQTVEGGVDTVDIGVLPPEDVAFAYVGAVVADKDGNVYEVYNPQHIAALVGEDRVRYSTEHMIGFAKHGEVEDV